MFMALLVVTFVTAFLVAWVVVAIFTRPVKSIVNRIVGDEISPAFTRYIQFALFVVGIGGGARVYSLEQYLPGRPGLTTELTTERWVLEIYQTVLGTLQSAAWLLLVFFVFALIALAVVRVMELRKAKTDAK